MSALFASGIASAGDFTIFLLLAPLIMIVVCLLAGLSFALGRGLRKLRDHWRDHHLPPPAAPAAEPDPDASDPTHPSPEPHGMTEALAVPGKQLQ